MGQEWPDAALDAVLPEMFFEAIERFPVELQDPARLWLATATAALTVIRELDAIGPAATLPERDAA